MTRYVFRCLSISKGIGRQLLLHIVCRNMGRPGVQAAAGAQ
jgi:hypothetical protein